jgi:TP901 family phage tail tape measure protein
MAQGFFQWQMAATLVMKPLQMVRNAWASINETLVKTEDAVISLQRVLNNPSLSNSDISGKLYNLAQRYGQTFDNVNDIAQNFARTGMSWVETIQATESALLALNVAELDATQASEGMIAIMQQFGYEASELTGIIDMLNKVADNFAVTTDKLLTALQRTGSSAKNAKLDLAETVGIITALSEATGRSGENIGTAVNSLIQ